MHSAQRSRIAVPLPEVRPGAQPPPDGRISREGWRSPGTPRKTQPASSRPGLPLIRPGSQHLTGVLVGESDAGLGHAVVLADQASELVPRHLRAVPPVVLHPPTT